MILIILFFIFLAVEGKFRPRIEYIEESKILLIFYNIKYSRKYFVIYKF